MLVDPSIRRPNVRVLVAYGHCTITSMARLSSPQLRQSLNSLAGSSLNPRAHAMHLMPQGVHDAMHPHPRWGAEAWW